MFNFVTHLLLFVLFVGTTSAEVTKVQRKCVDGKEYFDGCKWHSCSGGIESVLGEIDDCPYFKNKPIPPPADYLEPLPLKQKCVDGKRHFDGCNWHSCSNGEVLSTNRDCFKRIPPPTDFWHPRSSKRECYDGKRYFDGCNSNVCVRGIEVQTTWRNCFKTIPAPADFWKPLPVNPICVNGKRHFDGCNWHTCSGGAVSVTAKSCYTFIPPPSNFWEPLANRRCINGKSYYDGCNWHHCGGGMFSSTLIYCGNRKLIPPPEEILEPLPVKKPLYPQNTLERNGFLPIPKSSTPTPPRITVAGPGILPIPKRRTCVEGRRYYDGCNWHMCKRGIVVLDLGNAKYKRCFKPIPAPEYFWKPLPSNRNTVIRTGMIRIYSKI